MNIETKTVRNNVEESRRHELINAETPAGSSDGTIGSE